MITSKQGTRLKRYFIPRWIKLAVLVLSLFGLMGCVDDMSVQPRYEPLEFSEFFLDSRSARPIVDGTVPWGKVAEVTLFEIAEDETEMILLPEDEEAAGFQAFPFPITEEILERGQEQYDIYCSPCHGLAGYGNGPIVERGFPAPGSFHVDRLRQAPPGYYYQVITNGFGRMFPYDYRVRPFNRWAITAYIRALQLSQYAEFEDVPPEVLEELLEVEQ